MEKEAAPDSSRPPGKADLVMLCRALNAHGVRYIVVGGMAVIQQGYVRATDDIDLLLHNSPENIEHLRRALEILPDKAIREMAADDLENYTVVRVADEIVVDLMLETCGISYDQAQDEIERLEIDGVLIPFANATLLLKMKQTGREKDSLDLLFLQEKIAARK